jgi:hypothetical protein
LFPNFREMITPLFKYWYSRVSPIALMRQASFGETQMGRRAFDDDHRSSKRTRVPTTSPARVLIMCPDRLIALSSGSSRFLL